MATVTVTQQNFSELIDSNQTVFLDFWASWCGPCRMFAPVFEQSSEKHPGIVFGKIDTEAEQALAGAASITSIPTLMVIKDRTVVSTQSGALPPAALEDLVEQVEKLDVSAALAAQRQEDQVATNQA